MNNVASVPLCILEEIGLEGLEGITIEGLWKRLSVRLKLPLPLKDRLTNNVWQFVRNAKCLQFYELPEEREPLKLFDRADCTDPIFGNVEAVRILSGCIQFSSIILEVHFRVNKKIIFILIIFCRKHVHTIRINTIQSALKMCVARASILKREKKYQKTISLIIPKMKSN